MKVDSDGFVITLKYVFRNCPGLSNNGNPSNIQYTSNTLILSVPFYRCMVLIAW